MSKRLSLCAALLLAVSGCGHSGGDSKKADDKPSEQKGSKDSVTIDGAAQNRSGIQVSEVKMRQIPETLMAAGPITGNEDRTVHIGTYSDGRITQVNATVGDNVRSGQVLALMHSHELHEARAAYEVALQDVKLKQNALAYSERLAVRLHNLLEVKSASAQEIERTDAEVLNAKTNLNSAEINARKERDHLADILRVDPVKLPATLSEDIDLLPILSSISGTVIDRKVTQGAVVKPGDETFTVTDLSTVWMLASVNETDIAKLKQGAHAQLLTQAFPGQPFRGTVTRLGSELDPQTRTLRARITVPNARMQLRPEMFANAQIEEGLSRAAIFVPEEAVQDINGSSVVFVREANNKFTTRPIQIVRMLNGEAEVQSGLKAGDHVAVKGSFVVKSEILKSQIGE